MKKFIVFIGMLLVFIAGVTLVVAAGNGLMHLVNPTVPFKLSWNAVYWISVVLLLLIYHDDIFPTLSNIVNRTVGVPLTYEIPMDNFSKEQLEEMLGKINNLINSKFLKFLAVPISNILNISLDEELDKCKTVEDVNTLIADVTNRIKAKASDNGINISEEDTPEETNIPESNVPVNETFVDEPPVDEVTQQSEAVAADIIIKRVEELKQNYAAEKVKDTESLESSKSDYEEPKSGIITTDTIGNQPSIPEVPQLEKITEDKPKSNTFLRAGVGFGKVK